MENNVNKLSRPTPPPPPPPLSFSLPAAGMRARGALGARRSRTTPCLRYRGRRGPDQAVNNTWPCPQRARKRRALRSEANHPGGRGT